MQHCSSGFADLADVILVSEGRRLPAHSQILSFHSQFIQRLLHDLGPVSLSDPLVIDTALQGHSRAAVDLLLTAVYQQGAVNISSAQEAWQMYKLADHLDCPRILQQCREHIHGSSGTALVSSSPAAALEWIVAADELGWDDLRQQCAGSIARNYRSSEESVHLVQLPTQLSLMIMKEMVKQRSAFEDKVMSKVKIALQRRNGRASHCVSCWDNGTKWCHAYRFFCDKL